MRYSSSKSQQGLKIRHQRYCSTSVYLKQLLITWLATILQLKTMCHKVIAPTILEMPSLVLSNFLVCQPISRSCPSNSMMILSRYRTIQCKVYQNLLIYISRLLTMFSKLRKSLRKQSVRTPLTPWINIVYKKCRRHLHMAMIEKWKLIMRKIFMPTMSLDKREIVITLKKK